MVCAPVRSIIPSLKLGDYLSVQAHKPSSISHMNPTNVAQTYLFVIDQPGHVAQSVGQLTRKSGVPGSIPCLATYFRFYFRFFKKGRCQLLAKVCARSTG